jgi:hypothetical protein
LLQPAAERLYAWSIAHPQEAQPGLYLEYVNDSKRTPNERIVAVYDFAGVANTDETVAIFSKALAQGNNPDVRTAMSALLGQLT